MTIPAPDKPDSAEVVIAAFYTFTRLSDTRTLKNRLLALCRDNTIKGTILLASEGINGTVAGDRTGIDNLKMFLHADGRFQALEYKESHAVQIPFHRMKIKIKKEIVTMRMEDLDPGSVTGIHVGAARWNALLQDPDVLVLDVRNAYEFDIGTFANAVSSALKRFTDFPAYVQQEINPRDNPKIAMFCTGGIRCEKASAWMLKQGFKEVYQLKGGILRYLEEVHPEESLWQGECFVFDSRIAVNDLLQTGQYQQCYSCRMPLSPADRQSEKFEQGVSCPACHDSLTPARKASLRERQRQVEIAASRDMLHVGAVPS